MTIRDTTLADYGRIPPPTAPSTGLPPAVPGKGYSGNAWPTAWPGSPTSASTPIGTMQPCGTSWNATASGNAAASMWRTAARGLRTRSACEKNFFQKYSRQGCTRKWLHHNTDQPCLPPMYSSRAWGIPSIAVNLLYKQIPFLTPATCRSPFALPDYSGRLFSTKSFITPNSSASAFSSGARKVSGI